MSSNFVLTGLADNLVLRCSLPFTVSCFREPVRQRQRNFAKKFYHPMRTFDLKHCITTWRTFGYHRRGVSSWLVTNTRNLLPPCDTARLARSSLEWRNYRYQVESLVVGRDSAGEKADVARRKTSLHFRYSWFVGSVGVGSGTARDWRSSRLDEGLVSSGSDSTLTRWKVKMW